MVFIQAKIEEVPIQLKFELQVKYALANPRNKAKFFL